MSNDCLECGARGVISSATEDVICEACNGTGNASGRGTESPAAAELAAEETESSGGVTKQPS